MKAKFPKFRIFAVSVAAAMASAAMPALAQECEAKLGAVGPLSGSAAAWGLSVAEGAKFAAAVANEGGGIQVGDKKCQVKVFEFDAKYTAAGGAAAADYLASEDVHHHGWAGRVTGNDRIPSRRETSKIINFSSSYMRNVMTPEFPLAFHALQAPITWGPILIKQAQDQFGIKSVLITAPNDQGGTDSGKQLVKLYGDVGVQASEEYFQRGTTNFAPLVTRIMNANPDAIEMSSVPPADAAILVKQLLEAGYPGVIGSLGGTGVKPILEGAGGVENLKNVYWLEVSPVDHPGIIKLKEDYKRLFGKETPENPLFPVFALAAEVAISGNLRCWNRPGRGENCRRASLA